MSDVPETEREKFEAWALAEGLAYRDKNGLWFYPSANESDLWRGWGGHAAIGPLGTSAASDLASRLNDEADLCRNEGADDIARLLDEAARAIEAAVREQPKPQPQALHCPRCGFIWRPADVPTNGVAAIKTKGKNDSAPQRGDSAVASEGGSCVNAAAEIEALREALRDMLAGWQYIRSFHGDLYGVGWDRAEGKAVAALALSTAGAQRGASEQDETTAYEPLDSLDWERLKGGAFRALDPSHQWAFDALRLAKEQR